MPWQTQKPVLENFWNRVVFYNYSQYSQARAGVAPRSEHWVKSEQAFRDVLEEYIPDCIIVWGKRLYSMIPKWDSKESFIAISDTDKTGVRTYNVKGKDIPAIGVYHPCCPKGKSWTYWHKYYVKFLGLAE